jgi:hypothetical protein
VAQPGVPGARGFSRAGVEPLPAVSLHRSAAAKGHANLKTRRAAFLGLSRNSRLFHPISRLIFSAAFAERCANLSTTKLDLQEAWPEQWLHLKALPYGRVA